MSDFVQQRGERRGGGRSGEQSNAENDEKEAWPKSHADTGEKGVEDV